MQILDSSRILWSNPDSGWSQLGGSSGKGSFHQLSHHKASVQSVEEVRELLGGIQDAP